MKKQFYKPLSVFLALSIAIGGQLAGEAVQVEAAELKGGQVLEFTAEGLSTELKVTHTGPEIKLVEGEMIPYQGYNGHSFSMAAGSEYTFNGIAWYNVTDSYQYMAGDKFKAGKARITLTLQNTAKNFPDELMIDFNGTTSSWKGVTTYYGTERKYNLEVEIAGQSGPGEMGTEVTVTHSGPEIKLTEGEKIPYQNENGHSFSLAAGSIYSFGGISWYNVDQGYQYMSGDVFKAGKARIFITLQNAEKNFPDQLTINFNGTSSVWKSAALYNGTEKKYALDVEIEKQSGSGEVGQEITVTHTGPEIKLIAGEMIPYHNYNGHSFSMATGSDYTFGGIAWYNVDQGYQYMSGDVFKAGKARIIITLQNSEKTFPDQLMINFNGTSSVWKGASSYYGTERKYTLDVEITDGSKISISPATVTDIPEQSYTGSPVTPEVTVTLSGKTLVKYTDYTVIYTNNINVGTATVTITGIGKYEGAVSRSFRIVKKDGGSSAGTDVSQKETPKTEAQNNTSYKILSTTELTACYQAPEDISATNVVIPATVTLNGQTYKVTEIAANAFKNNGKIKKVTIGKEVRKIGKNAFYGCKNLKTISIQTTMLTKKSVAKNAFKKINAKAKVKVPKKKRKDYKEILKKAGINGKKQKIS